MKSTREVPNYYAIIPANVRYSKNLSAQEKLLYAEITALTNVRGYCWANNNYFADLYNQSKETISRQISKLSKNGFLKIEIIYFENSKQVKERKLYISNPYDEILINTNKNTPIDENVNTPIDENVKDNITSINNIKDINIKSKS